MLRSITVLRYLRTHMNLPPEMAWSWPSMHKVLCIAVPRKPSRQAWGP